MRVLSWDFNKRSLTMGKMRSNRNMCVCVCVCVSTQSLSCVQLFGTTWTAACQAPLSMGFHRREYCSGLPCPPPGDLPNPGIEPMSPALQADSVLLSH